MKELKFRAWDKEEKKMIGTYDDHQTFSLDFSGNIFSYEHGNSPFRHYVQEELILMQFTGLLDRNGVEIYCGDIILEINDLGEPMYLAEPLEVIFWEGTFCYKLSEDKGHLFNPKDVKVIGNVYQNPELIK